MNQDPRAETTTVVRIPVASLIAVLLLVGPVEAIADGPEPELAPARPEKTGAGLIVLGSASMVVGVGAIAGGVLMYWNLGEAGFLGAIPASLSGIFFGVGIPAVVAGSHRRAALRRWEAQGGIDRSTRSGAGLLSLGGVSLTAGLCMAIPGFIGLPPLATYEPGDARVAVWSSVSGTIGVVAGTTMIVMGAIQRRHHLYGPRSRVTWSASPWVTRTSAGFGVSGQF